MPLGAAKALLVEGFQSPQRLRDELAAGRMPCWDASGNAPGPEFWRSFEVNFEESMARTLLRISESGGTLDLWPLALRAHCLDRPCACAGGAAETR